MTLAEARMLCPHLQCFEHDPAADRRALIALGRWLTRFTSIVATGWIDDEDPNPPQPPNVLFLDITGCQKLFNGIPRLLDRVEDSLRRFGVSASLAVAPTPGSAWAFSLAQPTGRIVEPDQLQSALAPLPVHSLRLDEKILASLHHLGLCTIGQLTTLPREELSCRFGTSLLNRLNQAVGSVAEPLVWLPYEPPIAEKIEFDSPVESLETIWLIVEELLDPIVAELLRRNAGARRLELVCKPGDSHLPVVIKTIHLSAPTSRKKILLDLLRRSTEHLESDEGFISFRLNVAAHEKITQRQSDLFGEQNDSDEIELARLFERLRIRLGESSIIQPRLVESYLPELAWKNDPQSPSAPVCAPARPVCLLPEPGEIRVVCEPSDDFLGRPRQFAWETGVHRIVYVVGPERISGQWWLGHRHTRDYYDVEDEAGMRFWIFRVVRGQSVRWFLHGRF